MTDPMREREEYLSKRHMERRRPMRENANAASRSATISASATKVGAAWPVA